MTKKKKKPKIIIKRFLRNPSTWVQLQYQLSASGAALDYAARPDYWNNITTRPRNNTGKCLSVNRDHRGPRRRQAGMRVKHKARFNDSHETQVGLVWGEVTWRRRFHRHDEAAPVAPKVTVRVFYGAKQMLFVDSIRRSNWIRSSLHLVKSDDRRNKQRVVASEC